ncbi:19949_t:CDS:2, partial [Gigaspora rosea]
AGLEKLRQVCSRFAFESFIKQQEDLVKSGIYDIFESDKLVYNVLQINDKSSKTHIIHLESPSTCTCLNPQHTRTPCYHIIAVYLLHLHTYVLPCKVHPCWNVHHHAKMEHAIYTHITKIFEQLPTYHHDAFSNLMQQASEYILEYVEKSNLNVFKTISIDNAANCDKLKIPAVKCGPGRPPKTDAINQNSNNNGLLAIAILKDENRWRGVKVTMRDYLSKQEEIYSNILGYNIKWLIDVLSYTEPEYPQDYWFYMPECAQLASDAFNVLVVIFGANPIASLFFLLFNQKPGRRKKPIILYWRGNKHIILVQIKPNKNINFPPLNPQYYQSVVN